MSDCDCDCDCDCFGNSDGCCCDDAGGGPEKNTTYGAISTGDVVADCLDTAIDIGTDAYEPIPSNTSKKKSQNTDAETDPEACTDTCKWATASTLLLSVLSIIGN